MKKDIARKSRIILNFLKNPVLSIEKIECFLKKVNTKKYGERITLHEILADCVENYGDLEIKRLQESSLSPMDRVKIKFEKEMEKSQKKINFEEYLAKKLRV